MVTITRLRLTGWKSIQEATLHLRPLNVLIGANGTGKSNLLSFFDLLEALVKGDLASYVTKAGGANVLLYYGAKTTAQVRARLHLDTSEGQGSFVTVLDATATDSLTVNPEWGAPPAPGEEGWAATNFSSGGRLIGRLLAPANPGPVHGRISNAFLLRLRSYQFHDSSATAPIRLTGYIEDNKELHRDGRNLAAVLYKYRQTNPACYRRIVGTIRQIVPFFEDFVLEPRELNPQTILLNWKERGSDYLFGPHQLSDGALRAMALVTLLLQPEQGFPALVLIDEPELGLHPYALAVLASLLQKAAHHCQVIVATQSATLVDHFEPEDVVVAERTRPSSTFRRLSGEELADWLADYTLSELWEKNVFGGRPGAWLGST